MKKVNDFLGFAIEGKEVLKAARAQTALRSWPSVVGETLASKSIVEKFDHGTVVVEVDGSAWAQELRLNSETIIRRLNEIAGESGLFLKIRVVTRRSD